MKKLWQQSLIQMTKGIKPRIVVIQSLVLALLTVFFTFPYFYYLVTNVQPVGIDRTEILISQLFLLFIICLLCAMVGLLFSKRYALPGIGGTQLFLDAIPGLTVLGIFSVLISYFLLDRHLIIISPLSYPRNVFYLLILPFKEALTGEIILRLGLVTILVGVFKRKFAAVTIVAIFASFLSVKYYRFAGIITEGESVFIFQLFFSMVTGLLSGYLFVTRGLLPAMFFRFILGFRYAFVVWMAY